MNSRVIPRDVVGLLAHELFVPRRCDKSTRCVMCGGNLWFWWKAVTRRTCNNQILVASQTLKSLRAVCWKFSHVITVERLFNQCQNLSFRSRHLSWLIRANSTFAAHDLQTLQARADWARMIVFWDNHDTVLYVIDVADTFMWMLSRVQHVDKDPLIIYSADFTPPRARERLELVRAKIDMRWWLDYYDGGYRPFLPYKAYSRYATNDIPTGVYDGDAMFTLDFSTLYPSLIFSTNLAFPPLHAAKPYRVSQITAKMYSGLRQSPTAQEIVPAPQKHSILIKFFRDHIDKLNWDSISENRIKAGANRIKAGANRKVKSSANRAPASKKYLLGQKVPRQKYHSRNPGRHKLRYR